MSHGDAPQFLHEENIDKMTPRELINYFKLLAERQLFNPSLLERWESKRLRCASARELTDFLVELHYGQLSSAIILYLIYGAVGLFLASKFFSNFNHVPEILFSVGIVVAVIAALATSTMKNAWKMEGVDPYKNGTGDIKFLLLDYIQFSKSIGIDPINLINYSYAELEGILNHKLVNIARNIHFLKAEKERQVYGKEPGELLVALNQEMAMMDCTIRVTQQFGFAEKGKEPYFEIVNASLTQPSGETLLAPATEGTMATATAAH